MAALGTVSAGAATAKAILAAAITHATADSYDRSWGHFANFCADNGWPALPTAEPAVACYYATMCERGLKANTMRRYFTSVNNMHVAKGYPKPATGPAFTKLRKGWARILADQTNSLPETRGPLPAAHMEAIVHMAHRTTDGERRRRLTAVLLAFLVSRRTTEVLELQYQDISLLPDGAFHIEVQRYKNAEGRDEPRRLVYTIPVDPDLPTDPALDLLRSLVNEMATDQAPPNRLVFSTLSLPRAPTLDDLTAWLLAALAELNIKPPPGVLYSSYSCRSGGATALYVCGVPPVAVAAMLGHKDNDTRTAIARYIDVLAPSSSSARRLCGRWLHRRA